MNGHRRLVWDSEEEYRIELNADSFCVCSGVGSRNVCVMEMVKQH